MKKLLSVILTLAIVFIFSACEKEKNTSELSSEVVEDTSSVQTVVSSQTVSSSTPSTTSTVSSTPSKKTETTSEVEQPKVVYPEKVVAVYSYQNQFKMPDTEKKTFYDSVNGITLPYRLFMPHDYNPKNKYPVILFLHGKGEIGTDNQDQLSGISKLFKDNGDLAASAFVICPQSYEWWNFDFDKQYAKGTLSSALRLLEMVESTYSCDPDRLYVTGLSMGGCATWDMLENYGYKFAAGMPLCGFSDANKGALLKDIPIRIYHGTADTTVHYSSSQEMYDAIKNAGGQKVEFIRLEGVNHNAWDPTYSDRDAISWLLAQNKQTNPTCDYEIIPYLRIIDSSGATVISDEDMHALSYSNDYEESGIYSVDFILSESGKNKLNRAYKTSNGKPFTFYCGTQKIYTFTATSALPDNVYSIRGIFDKINYQAFFDMIEKIVYN